MIYFAENLSSYILKIILSISNLFTSNISYANLNKKNKCQLIFFVLDITTRENVSLSTKRNGFKLILE